MSVFDKFKDPQFDELNAYVSSLTEEGRSFGLAVAHGDDDSSATLIVPLDAQDADYPTEVGGITLHLLRVSIPMPQ